MKIYLIPNVSHWRTRQAHPEGNICSFLYWLNILRYVCVLCSRKGWELASLIEIDLTYTMRSEHTVNGMHMQKKRENSFVAIH